MMLKVSSRAEKIGEEEGLNIPATKTPLLLAVAAGSSGLGSFHRNTTLSLLTLTSNSTAFIPAVRPAVVAAAVFSHAVFVSPPDAPMMRKSASARVAKLFGQVSVCADTLKTHTDKITETTAASILISSKY